MSRPAAALLLLGAISCALLAARCTPQIPLPPPEEEHVTSGIDAADAAAPARDAQAEQPACDAGPPGDGAPTTDAGAPALGPGTGPAVGGPS